MKCCLLLSDYLILYTNMVVSDHINTSAVDHRIECAHFAIQKDKLGLDNLKFLLEHLLVAAELFQPGLGLLDRPFLAPLLDLQIPQLLAQLIELGLLVDGAVLRFDFEEIPLVPKVDERAALRVAYRPKRVKKSVVGLSLDRTIRPNQER